MITISWINYYILLALFYIRWEIILSLVWTIAREWIGELSGETQFYHEIA